MSFNGSKVVHLEIDDFQNNVLTYHNKQLNKRVPVKGTWIVMVQGDYCGYCKNNKPTFVQLGNRLSSFDNGPVFATVQVDGQEAEKALSKQLPTITNKTLGGVPAILKFLNGEFVAMVMGARTDRELVEFMNQA